MAVKATTIAVGAVSVILIVGLSGRLPVRRSRVPPSRKQDPAKPPLAKRDPRWHTFRSDVLKFEVQYPPYWGMVKQGDGLIDFGPGKPKPAAGKVLLDLLCVYNESTKIYGEKTVETVREVRFGPNSFVEKKIYVVTGEHSRLAFRNFTMKLPDSYRGNHCRKVSFIVREECNRDLLAKMLASFQVLEQ